MENRAEYMREVGEKIYNGFREALNNTAPLDTWRGRFVHLNIKWRDHVLKNKSFLEPEKLYDLLSAVCQQEEGDFIMAYMAAIFHGNSEALLDAAFGNGIGPSDIIDFLYQSSKDDVRTFVSNASPAVLKELTEGLAVHRGYTI